MLFARPFTRAHSSSGVTLFASLLASIRKGAIKFVHIPLSGSFVFSLKTLVTKDDAEAAAKNPGDWLIPDIVDVAKACAFKLLKY